MPLGGVNRVALQAVGRLHERIRQDVWNDWGRSASHRYALQGRGGAARPDDGATPDHDAPAAGGTGPRPVFFRTERWSQRDSNDQRPPTFA